MLNSCWQEKSAGEVIRALQSDTDMGLSNSAIRRLQAMFVNKIEEEKRISPVKILLDQFMNTMILVLLAATVISGIVGAMADAVTIMAIVILNAILGFIQEYRAERSLEEIKKLASAHALVVRNGQRIRIKAEQLVPGDIVIINTGDKIPADLRLLETFSMEIDESTLTGESHPVSKNADLVLNPDTPLADHKNMAYMGTAVTRGRGKAIVVETGSRTVIGQIARIIKETEASMTPLQKKLDHLGKVLIAICIAVCAVVATLGIYRGEDMVTMLLAGISLAVAAIPEGLPAIVTVVLALGVQRMAKRNAIVRKLPAVETLGCTTVICSDKTGTLTQNKMMVTALASMSKVIEVQGDGYNPRGRFLLDGRDINPLADQALETLMQISLNCNNSMLEQKQGEYVIQGDPTEGALLVMANKAGIENKAQVLREVPFDSDRKRMSVVVKDKRDHMLLVKGSLDILLPRCSKVMIEQKVRAINEIDRNKILALQDQWGTHALRVLAFACRTLDDSYNKLGDEELERDLVLIGICGIIDPPRPGVAASVERCLSAGVIPIMITGDHPETARAIAAQVGIGSTGRVISGSEIDRISDDELSGAAISSRVFARVTPQHKHRIVKALKQKKHIVAMTGDGVNDAPAVKAADIGIAMGIAGTEVTKEASSIVLADDDFSTIVRAIYEGRAIYDNIRKFIRYLLGCNIGEVLVMFVATLLGFPLPMLPIQILWVNLVTDGLPAMALGLEPPEPGIMNRKPRAREESIFSHRLGWTIVGRGVYITTVTLLAFTIGLIYCRWNNLADIDTARTMAFTTLVFAQLFYVFECRSEKFTPFELGMMGNKFLLYAVGCSILMHLGVLYLPALQNVFNTVGLELWQWGVILILAGIKLLWKYILFQSRKIVGVMKLDNKADFA
ncbi:cation-transporting atpase [hydrocarbon metagenome]|uniref:Cation-transporting atpase n=1 Tax=hydrocarbon metagenome TaxID=938273 RepID=A0A0W8E5W8_9ZZZZ